MRCHSCVRVHQFDRAERLIREQLTSGGGRYQVLRVESAVQKALVINLAYAIPHLGTSISGP